MKKITIVLCQTFLLTFLSSNCAPAQSNPDIRTAQGESVAGNLAEQRAMGFIKAFNSGDAAKYEAYMQDNRTSEILSGASPAERLESYHQLREMFGAFEVLGVMQPSDVETRILVRTAQEEELEIIFQHQSDIEAKITSISFEASGPEIDVDPDWENLQELLSRYVEQSGVPAWSVAIVKDGKIIDQATVGRRSIEDDTPVSEESRFHWGSVTKSLTGTVIGALIEEGLLDWDTTIGEVFSQHSVRDVYKSVTISQLMAHRAGIPPYENFNLDFINGLKEKFGEDLRDQRKGYALDILENDTPIFQPGEGHRYSNAGITIAGLMAEEVSGQTWEDLVRQKVFQVANMTDAGFGWPATIDEPDQTRGHFGAGPDDVEVAPYDVFRRILEITAPAGNAHSTIRDFAHYANLHMQGMKGLDGAIKAETIQLIHTPLPKELLRVEPYSFGWGQVELENGDIMHWHNGGAGSFYAEIRLIPESDVAIVIMANAGFAESAIRPLWSALYERYLAN